MKSFGFMKMLDFEFVWLNRYAPDPCSTFRATRADKNATVFMQECSSAKRIARRRQIASGKSHADQDAL
jgi:hypothetical protein